MRKQIFLACLVLFISSICPPFSISDSYAPSHYCRKPYKPYEFNSQFEIDAYMGEVERYKRCIMHFIEEQEDAMEVHREAAEEALEEWNRFVRFELN